MDVVYSVANNGISVLERLVCELGAGCNNLYDDFSQALLLSSVFLVAFLLSYYTRLVVGHKTKALPLGFSFGLLRGMLLVLSNLTQIILIDVFLVQKEKVFRAFEYFIPVLDGALNFICMGVLSISLMFYALSQSSKDKIDPENISDHLSILKITTIWSLFCLGTVHILNLYFGKYLYSTFDFNNFYWHFLTLLLLIIPTTKLLLSEGTWVRNSVLNIFYCWIFYTVGGLLDVFITKSSSFMFLSLSNIALLLSIPIFIFIYLKELFLSLEIKSNEARQLASDREFIIKGFSHEIRTPLMALSGYLAAYNITNKKFNAAISDKNRDALRECCPKGLFCNKVTEEGVPEMQTAVRYISGILDNLSQYGRDSSKHAISKVEINNLTGVAVKYTKFTDEAKKIPSSSIKCFPSEMDIYVRLSPSKYLQIIQNILRNSIRAVCDLEDRDPCISVETTRSEDRKWCVVTIADNGNGMNKDQIQSCTDKYWTTKKTLDSSNGLGLYFARMYVEEFGGHISIDSEINVGTCVSLHFPLTNYS